VTVTHREVLEACYRAAVEEGGYAMRATACDACHTNGLFGTRLRGHNGAANGTANCGCGTVRYVRSTNGTWTKRSTR
jgi:hypothetical protein